MPEFLRFRGVLVGGIASIILCCLLVPIAAFGEEPHDDKSTGERVSVPPDSLAGTEASPERTDPEDGVEYPNNPQPAGTVVVNNELVAEESEPRSRAPQVLDEMVVTATKREQLVSDISVSIDAFSGKDLEEQGKTDLEGILKQSPGVILMKSTADSQQIIIRGSGSAPFNFAFNRPFGMFFGDVPLVNPTLIGVQPDIDSFDLQTVEILKGPQGTLFGGAALVGAIRYVPNTPQFDGAHGSISYGYGAVSESGDRNANYTIMFNEPIGSNAAIRFAGSVRDTAGYIEDVHDGRADINGVRNEQGRLMVAWDVLTDLHARLSYLERHVNADAMSGNIIDNIQGRLEQGRLRESPDESKSKIGLGGATIEWSGFDPFTLVVSSNVLPKEATFLTDLGPGGLVADPTNESARTSTKREQKSTQVTHEARIVSNDRTTGGVLFRDWDYLVGLFQLKVDQANRQEVTSFEPDPVNPNLPGQEVILIALANADTEERALFFDLNRHLFDDSVTLNLGGRFFKQETPASLLVRQTTRSSGQATPEQPVGEDTYGTLKDSGFNPKAGLIWSAMENVSFFTSAVKGFRFGGVNPDPFLTGEPPKFYESDSLWNYEMGARSWWLDNRLNVNVTAFQIDWENKQVPLLTSSRIRTQFIANIGGSRIRGGEASVRTLLPYGLSVLLNGAYVQSKTTAPFNEPSAGKIPAGTLEPNSPFWMGSSTLKYKGQWGQWDLGASASYSYQGPAKNDWQNFAPLDSVQIFDVSFNIASSAWPMSPKLSLNIINLADSRALLNASANRPKGAADRVEGAAVVTPRTVTLTVGFSY